jgi:hypothetical protein
MNFEYYVLLVAVAALIYAFIARIIQNKLMDKKEMAAMTAESKRLSEEYKSASKTGDKANVDRVMKEQMDMLPRMNKVMMSQFKPMIVVLMVFFAFNWAVSTFDPTKADDLTVIIKDDGAGCDKVAGDGVYSTCFNFPSSGLGPSKWVVSAHAMSGESEIGMNSTFVYFNMENSSDTFLLSPSGEPVPVVCDKKTYYPGDTATLRVTPPKRADAVKLILNNGTAFYVDLPFTIPLFNVQRLHDPYWWFIFVALIGGIVISVIMGKLEKKPDANATKKLI